MTFLLDEVPFEMREPHDLSFLQSYGKVFCIMDRLTSGNLCFGVEGPFGRLFIKYAGAPTINYTGRPQAAVRTLSRAMPLYFSHPALPRLYTHGPAGTGYAAIFEWIDAVPLRNESLQSPLLPRLRALPLTEQLAMMESLFSLHITLAEKGFIAIDLSPRNLLIDPVTASCRVCDIDLYTEYPRINTTGRMPGEADFLAPQETTPGATLDQRTTVWKLGMIALWFFSSATTDRTAALPAPLLPIVKKATEKDPQKRYLAVQDFVSAWRAALGGLWLR